MKIEHIIKKFLPPNQFAMPVLSYRKPSFLQHKIIDHFRNRRVNNPMEDKLKLFGLGNCNIYRDSQKEGEGLPFVVLFQIIWGNPKYSF